MRVSQGLAWLIILLPSPLPPLLIHLLLVLFPYDSLIILISLSILITIWKCLLNSAKCNRKYVAYCGRLFVEEDSNLRRYNGLELIQRSMGVHPPWGHDTFPPVSDFPHIFDKFSDCGKFKKCYLFPTNFSIFIRQNFWWSFFSHRPQIPCFSTFPLCFAKQILFPPTFDKFPPCIRKSNRLFTYFMCISFAPTFTMMHLCITQCTYWTPLQRSAVSVWFN